jgi:DNA (cytosine-5)-methyltransferase 1
VTAYYNEYEKFAAQWLRNLIAADLIAPGEVDERSIRDVQPDDLRDFVQCHFFAGIGVWSHVLRRAGWPDDREIWTGSCPCQPFSVAGAKRGLADDRHLWPEFFRLIGERRPGVVVGEQVSSSDGLGWFDAVSADLEGAGYATGALDTCAAGVGAPHMRHRLYWLAHTVPAGRAEGWTGTGDGQATGSRGACGMGDASESRGGRDTGTVSGAKTEGGGRRIEDGSFVDQPVDAGTGGRVANPDGGQPSDGELQRGRRLVQFSENPLAGFWRDADWILCTDSKARPVEAGTFPLAHGAPKRLGRLRGYGNALCAPQAEAFVRAAMECLP